MVFSWDTKGIQIKYNKYTGQGYRDQPKVVFQIKHYLKRGAKMGEKGTITSMDFLKATSARGDGYRF